MAKNNTSTENTTKTPVAKVAGKVSMVRCLKGNILKDLQLGESYTVTGSASRFEIGQTNFGEFVKFGGNFAIKFREDIYTSSNLILPKVGEDLLRTQLETREDPNAEFLFMLKIAKEEKPKRTPIDCGYEWTASLHENVKIEAPKNPFVQLLLEVG